MELKFHEKYVLTLDGNKRYFVVKIINYGVDKILYLLNIDNFKDYKFMIIEKDNELIEIDDISLIEELKKQVYDDKEKNLADIDIALSYVEELNES